MGRHENKPQQSSATRGFICNMGNFVGLIEKTMVELSYRAHWLLEPASYEGNAH